MQIDDQDRRLLRQYQADPTQSATELAERAGMARATCWRRLERLQESGVIKGQTAVIDWRALGYGVEVSLRISLDKTVQNAFDIVMAKARDIPEVVEIQTFLGRVDLRLSVIARDMGHYQEIYRERILTLPHIADLEALMQIASIKSSESLPL
ncbi:Lrp/AsnC family transcriptional regulator [Qingshengfaniella alkalisoli]|uniref:Lrp/AsnC family transcriptional regulator n=1 Tax=Qingshengfaniella alkalisoli TaxID=2599296 RepID=A0A5B8I8P4_9RHOB|nr:Lrp/AsnC family transcriptional regulator [Qingshengfaniella alkalisoli]QDY69116.1 Lrp/AsnC family transcriptional regulator [Qingshengfaniella alkalisoli]